MNRQIVSSATAQATRNNPELAGLQVNAMSFLSDTKNSDTTSTDTYKDKLLKLIPAEAIAAYLSLIGIVSSSANGSSANAWMWVIFVVALVGTPLYLWRLQGVTAPVQLVLSTVSFAVWGFSLGGPFTQYGWYHMWIGSVILIAFTFLIPPIVGKTS